MLEIKNIFGGYTKEPVLKGISFGIEQGEFLGIIGPNGSGKSTLLRLMSRVLTPQKGSILFEGNDIGSIQLKELCRRIAFVSQETLISFFIQR